MHETLISIEGLDPVVILGNENTNLRALQRLSPKLRIEQGATIIPIVLKEPLEMAAAMSLGV